MDLSHPAAATKPVPHNHDDRVRWSITSPRRQILYNQHRKLARELAKENVGSKRDRAWKSPDLAVNVAESITGQLAAMYRIAPVIHHPDAGAAKALTDLLDRAEVWPLMSRVQRDALGLRECFLRLDVDKAGEISPRIAFPDEVLAKGFVGKPDRPREVRELRLRENERGEERWYWDVMDVKARTYTVEDSEGKDVSSQFLAGDGYTGDYSAVYGDTLPYIIYRAAKTGTMWCPTDWAGLFAGTLQSVVMRTFFGHCFRQSSWPQRNAIDLEPAGASANRDGDDSLVTDPATIMQWRQTSEEGNTGTLHQWMAAANPAELLATIGAYERGVITSIGISASDILRTSEDPRSGLALAVSREGRREAQRQWEPLFRASDLEMIRTSATMHNAVSSDSIPVDGYTLHYRALPLSPAEKAAKRAEVLELMDRGLMSKVDAYREFNPGVSDEQAIEALRNIQTINAELSQPNPNESKPNVDE